MNHLRTLSAGVLAVAVSVTGLLVTGPSYADAPRERYDVVIKVSDHAPEVKDRITIKGFVGPAASGQRVLLQVRYADQKQWKTLDAAKLNGASRYRFTEKVKTVRERAYRVVKPALAGSGRAVSTREKVTVFGWRDLTSLDPVGYNGINEDPATINGVAYPASVVEVTYPVQPVRTIDYNLNRDCTQLTGTAGLSDSSQVNGTSTVAISTDGVSKFSQSFALTQKAPVTVDLTNVFRLSVSATSLNGGLGAVGTPRVYCSF